MLVDPALVDDDVFEISGPHQRRFGVFEVGQVVEVAGGEENLPPDDPVEGPGVAGDDDVADVDLVAGEDPVLHDRRMVLLVLDEVGHDPHVGVAHVGDLGLDVLHVAPQLVDVEDVARLDLQVVLEDDRVDHLLRQVDLDLLDLVDGPFGDLEVQNRLVVVEIDPQQRIVDLAVEVAVAHVEVADAGGVVLELVDLHLSVVEAPHPAHEIPLTVGHHLFDLALVQMLRAAEVQLLDDDVLTLVDLELHLHAAVLQGSHFALDDGVEEPLLGDGTSDQRFGALDLPLVVDVPLLQADRLKQLLPLVFAVAADEDLGDDRLLFEVEGQNAPLFGDPDVLEIALGVEFADRFVHLLDVDRLAGVQPGDFPGDVGRQVQQPVEADLLDLLAVGEEREKDERQKTFHWIPLIVR